MTAPEPEAGGLDANVRGMLVLAAAVLVGLLLLWEAGDGGGGPTTVVADQATPASATAPDPLGTDVTTATDSPLTTTTGASGTTAGSPGTTAGGAGTTAASSRQPAEVMVLVLNGSGPGGPVGAASAATDSIGAKGYQVADPANATVQPPNTVVYYRDGYQGDAALVAAVLGKDSSAVEPAPATSPGPGSDEANVVVVLGKDTAPVGDTTSGTG